MREPVADCDWIAVDWGTTNMRAWAMVGNRAVASTDLARGMGGLSREDYEYVLLEAVGPWLPDRGPIDIVACGMVGSRQGWIEADYASVPCRPLGDRPLTLAPAADPRLVVHIVAGLKQLGPADVMRGEETQLAGLIDERPGFSGIVCLPGTHAKWARIRAGRVESFSTFMTGELFSLLSRQSVLRHTVSGDGWDDDAYAAAVSKSLKSPDALFQGLFGLRAGALVADLQPAKARARLSGLLIGAELAAARRLWQDETVLLIGADTIARHYAGALAIAGVSAKIVDATQMTLRGLSAARAFLQASRTFP